jgi:hypothetical protein
LYGGIANSRIRTAQPHTFHYSYMNTEMHSARVCSTFALFHCQIDNFPGFNVSDRNESRREEMKRSDRMSHDIYIYIYIYISHAHMCEGHEAAVG